MSDNRRLYRAICSDWALPLPFQPWWLDAVCPEDQWDVCLGFDRGGRPTGAWPYFLAKRMGMRAVVQPPHTAYTGPWLFYPDEPEMKRPAVYTFETQTLEELQKQLPRVRIFQQLFHPALTNGYPFVWAGYRLNIRYTYIFPFDNQLHPAFEWRSSLKNKIHQTQELVQFVENVEPETALALYKISLERLGLHASNNKGVLPGLIRALDERNQIALLGLERLNDRRVVAVQAVAFDDRQASFLFSGQTFERSLPHLNYRLLAECMNWCFQRGLPIDFEGSMHRGLEAVFRSMGGIRTPYFSAHKAQPRALAAGMVLMGRW